WPLWPDPPLPPWPPSSPPLAGGDVELHGSGVHDVAVLTVPPAAVQAPAVRSSHSASPSPPLSGRQHTTSPWAGGVGAQGFGAHDVAWTTVPPCAMHSACVRSSHSGPESSGMQHTMPPPTGGAPTQGFGRHAAALDTVPPSAAHSSAVRSSHSGPESSGMQHTTSAGEPGCTSGKLATSTSSPFALRTAMVSPRGSNPSARSLPRGRDLNRTFPPPPPLVTRSPTCMPPTISSNLALRSSLRTRISNWPTLAALSNRAACPLAFASTPVVASDFLTFGPLAAAGECAAATRANADSAMYSFIVRLQTSGQQPVCRAGTRSTVSCRVMGDMPL